MTPTGLSILAFSTGALVMYKAPTDTSGREIATSYKIYSGTDVNTSKWIPVTFKAMGTHDDNYILTGLTNGATYFNISALDTTESAPSPVVGPVTIYSESGGVTLAIHDS